MDKYKFHDAPVGALKRCQISGRDDLELVVDLGHQPLCDSLLSLEQLDQPEKTFPLRITRSRSLGHTQLDYVVDGSEVFHREYPYRCGVTKEVVDHHQMHAKASIQLLDLKPGSLIVDVGSNDGTLLKHYQGMGMKVMGVEPTNVANYAKEKNGIPTIQSFFTEEVARDIREKMGPTQLITATNVFAHMATMGEVIRGIQALLADDGYFILENHYMVDIIKNNQYDTFYHEHVRNYSLKSLVYLFDLYGMTVVDAEVVRRYNGSIRVTVSKKKQTPRQSVEDTLQYERKSGLFDDSVWESFVQGIYQSKNDLLRTLLDLKSKNKSVVGNSCPGRGSTLINFCGIGKDLIPYLAEQPHSPKLGLYLPGKHIPVISNEILFKEQPDYVLLLAWHYAESIMQDLRKRGLKSKFIVPLPTVKIVD
jgi:SAM-dependent methyltransferase